MEKNKTDLCSGDGQFSALVGQFSADKMDNLAADHSSI